MGTLELFFCILVSQLIAVQSKEQDVVFFQDLPGYSENLRPFPLEAKFDFTPYDTIFSSWRTPSPDFHLLAESPPLMSVPGVQVFCDESELILLVDKFANGAMLTKEEIRLGDSCYSNRELPNHFVFTYALDQCGTTYVSGLKMFTNSLHLNLHEPPPSWLQTPSTLHISCIPERPFDITDFASPGLPETDVSFSIQAMNPSWTNNAESNVYKRDQVVNLRVSTKPRPNQQLFIQSCFVTASPDPHIKHKHMVIMNKGCTAHTAAQFVTSDRAHVVNFVLNTTYPYDELYVHCSVLCSDQGVTSGSKSCNYNMIHSRWEELGGDVEVCKCCSSKCRGLSVKHRSAGVKGIVSIGPLVFVDTNVEANQIPEPEETVNIPMSYSMKLDSSSEVPGNMVVYGKSSSPPQGVVVVRQDPETRLTLWQFGQGQADSSQSMASQSENNFQLQLGPVLTLDDGWVIPQQLDSSVILEEFQGSNLRGFRKFGTGAPQVTLPLSDELNENDPDHFRDEIQADAPVMLPEVKNDVQPIIRSKIQFSKGADGSQTLSYEEQVVGEHEGKGLIRRCGMEQSAHKGTYARFLDLLRTMDRAE